MNSNFNFFKETSISTDLLRGILSHLIEILSQLPSDELTEIQNKFFEQKKIQEKIIEQKSETVQSVESIQQSQIITDVPEKLISYIAYISDNVKQLLEDVQEFAHLEKTNDNLHKELQKYKEGFSREFITPLLKQIIREYDRVVKQYEFFCKKAQETSQNEQSEIFKQLLNEFKVSGDALLNLLNDNFIEEVEAIAGEKRIAQTHRIAKIIETTDEIKNDTVESMVLCGFRDYRDGRLIRPVEVNVYKYVRNSE
ncbi:MAG: hypothetical protein LBG17_03675 [Bacteroidales bacterium]|jgi:hypothetical protein|nr:hypothetical protein [Bacteroidales bacterium]